MGFGVWGLGFGVWGLGFRLVISGVGVWASGFGVCGFGLILVQLEKCGKHSGQASMCDFLVVGRGLK